MSEPKPAPQLFDVVLLKNHTHAGKDYAAGATISVTEPEHDWLAEHGIIAK